MSQIDDMLLLKIQKVLSGSQGELLRQTIDQLIEESNSNMLDNNNQNSKLFVEPENTQNIQQCFNDYLAYIDQLVDDILQSAELRNFVEEFKSIQSMSHKQIIDKLNNIYASSLDKNKYTSTNNDIDQKITKSMNTAFIDLYKLNMPKIIPHVIDKLNNAIHELESIKINSPNSHLLIEFIHDNKPDILYDIINSIIKNEQLNELTKPEYWELIYKSTMASQAMGIDLTEMGFKYRGMINKLHLLRSLDSDQLKNIINTFANNYSLDDIINEIKDFLHYYQLICDHDYRSNYVNMATKTNIVIDKSKLDFMDIIANKEGYYEYFKRNIVISELILKNKINCKTDDISNNSTLDYKNIINELDELLQNTYVANLISDFDEILSNNKAQDYPLLSRDDYLFNIRANYDAIKNMQLSSDDKENMSIKQLYLDTDYYKFIIISKLKLINLYDNYNIYNYCDSIILILMIAQSKLKGNDLLNYEHTKMRYIYAILIKYLIGVNRADMQSIKLSGSYSTVYQIGYLMGILQSQDFDHYPHKQDLLAGVQAQRSRQKGWTSLQAAKNEVLSVAEAKWKDGDTGLHNEMADFLLDRLKEKHPLLSRQIIIDTLKPLARKYKRLFGMRGVKKDKDN